MAVHEIVCLEHPRALTDGHQSGEKGPLQSALGRLSARPGVMLLDQHLVVDIADRQRPRRADEVEHFAHSTLGDGAKPGPREFPRPPHVSDEEAKAIGRHIRESIRPILEYGFVDGLRLAKVSAPVARDARPQDMMMTAFDY